jgi:hypothetical protein
LGLWLMSGDDVELEVKGRVCTHGSSSKTTGRSISLPCRRRPFPSPANFDGRCAGEWVEGRRGRGLCGLASSDSPGYVNRGERGKQEWTKVLTFNVGDEGATSPFQYAFGPARRNCLCHVNEFIRRRPSESNEDADEAGA